MPSILEKLDKMLFKRHIQNPGEKRDKNNKIKIWLLSKMQLPRATAMVANSGTTQHRIDTYTHNAEIDGLTSMK